MLTWPSSADALLLIDVLDSGTTSFLNKILVKTNNEKNNSFEI